MDSTTIREIPPLRSAWTRRGEQACVPIIGSHAKRVLSGVMNILTGHYVPYVSPSFRQGHFQDLLQLMRAQWRGWHLVLFLDRSTVHRADASQALAAELHIELRWLPSACPELNVMEMGYSHCSFNRMGDTITWLRRQLPCFASHFGLSAARPVLAIPNA